MRRDPNDRLQELLDRQEILDCLARYCRGVDRLDEEVVRSAFHEDGVDWHGQFVGSPKEFFEWVSERQAPGRASQHYVTNALIELDGDVAHVESYVLTAVRLMEGTGVSLSGGRYADRFERRNGEWRIAVRVCVGEWRASADGTGSDVFEREGYALGARDHSDVSYVRPLPVPVPAGRLVVKFTAAILPGPGEPIVLDEIEIGDPGPREVLVKLHAAGICRSQLTQMHTPRAVPMLLGHEAAGEVLATGAEVSRMSEGDHVLLAAVPTTPSGEEYPAGTTWRWRGEEYVRAHTDNVNVFAWATHTLVDERNLTPIPNTVPTDVTAILGCAGVTGCGSVVNVAKVQKGESAVVWGVGGVGLCAVAAAAIVGADPVVAVDVDGARLALARKLGATHGVDANAGDAVDAVREMTGGGADYVFDTVGTTDEALRATRAGIPGRTQGGMAVSIGRPTSPPNLKDLLCMGRIYAHSSAGNGRPTRDLPRYVEWYQQGKFPLEELVTRRYRLEEINEATRDLAEGRLLGRAIVVYD